jgi:hypothetical protein
MKKLCVLLFGCFVLTSVLSLVRVETAHGRSTYAKAFKEKYVGEEETEAQKSLAAEIKRVKTCNVCHDPRPDESGKANKKNRNPFGQTLAKYMSEEDQKDKEKALKMLAKIEGEKAKDAEKTFGELIKSGKVPFEYKDAE